MNSDSYNSSEDFFQIDIKTLVDAVVLKIKMIILFALAFGVSAFIISEFVITPKYMASITMCINNNKTMVTDSMDYNDVNASITLVPTYVELIQSYNVLNEVAAKTHDLGYTADDISGMIGVATKEETQIIMLSVINPNPEHANIIANAIAKVAPEKIIDLMEGTNVKVVDESVLPETPVSPSVKKNTVLGFLFGGFLGVALAVLLALLDNSVKSEDDLIHMFKDIPVLGVIPEFINEENESLDSDNKANKETKDV